MTRRVVKVEVTGGLRRASVAVDAVNVELFKSGDVWSGQESITLEPPMVNVTSVVKGGRHATFKVIVTINGTSRDFGGYVTEGILRVAKDWTFADFGL